MSCLGLLTARQRAALAASDAGGPPLSRFDSPPPSDGKVGRLRALGASARPAIRESAALAAYAPADLLERLAGDPAASVRACVARNPGARASLLERLATDPDPVVRGWAAAHRACPAGVRRGLAEDADPRVRAVVAWAERW